MSHGTANIERIERSARRVNTEREDYRAQREAQHLRRQERRGARRAAASGRRQALASLAAED